MNELDDMIETREAKTSAPIAAASRSAYLGLLVVFVIAVAVLWSKARR